MCGTVTNLVHHMLGVVAIFARRGSRFVHTLHQMRESMLLSYHASMLSVRAFQNFTSLKAREWKKIIYNIVRMELACLCNQKLGWQTLFSCRISHLIGAFERRRGISPTNQHLHTIDGHNPYVTLEVVEKAMKVGLNLLTLLSHTCNHLQPLDVSIFGPCKMALCFNRDV